MWVLTVRSGPIHEKVSLEKMEALCSGYFSGTSGTGGIVRPVKIVKSRCEDRPFNGVLFSEVIPVVVSCLQGHPAITKVDGYLLPG
jgi:hypothetical protein